MSQKIDILVTEHVFGWKTFTFDDGEVAFHKYADDSAYKLKFSLGYSFGENGFVKISRNPYAPNPNNDDKDNPCGICNQGSMPLP